MPTTTFKNDMRVTGDLQVDGSITAGGDAVASGTQVANITAPTGGSTEDAEARAAIVSIIAALEAFGIAASS